MQAEYVEMIKKFKGLEKEKITMHKIIDELGKANDILEREFGLLFK